MFVMQAQAWEAPGEAFIEAATMQEKRMSFIHVFLQYIALLSYISS